MFNQYPALPRLPEFLRADKITAGAVTPRFRSAFFPSSFCFFIPQHNDCRHNGKDGTYPNNT
jgi:hypothetical protein